MSRLIAQLGLACSLVSSLTAQRYNFKFYGDEEGLHNLAVQVILQDRQGFMWAGTQNGLYRYDGSQFTAFGKGEGLPGARIESLHEAIDGTLWVGTGTGLARRKGDKFETVPLGVAQGIVGRQGIASDRAGRLYLATERGLAVGNGPDFKLIPRPDGAAAVYLDGFGSVWFGCGTNLCQVDGDRAKEVGRAEGLPGERWDAILSDYEGNLWVRSEHSLYMRPSGTHKFQSRGDLPESRNTYPTLALDPAGRLLVPTYRGLARQVSDGWQIIEAKDGLTTNDISAVVRDREGSVWVGLLGSGLARWLGYDEWQSWSETEGLSRESIWSMTRDSDGRLWVGTQFGLNYAEDRKGKLVWHQQPLSGVEMIRSLAAAPDGTLWIGSDPGGLRQLNPRNHKVKTIRMSDHVRHVMVDREGRVWVSTREGLYRGDARSSKFELLAPPGTDPSESFQMALTDRMGQVWVAGDHGLARFAKNQWTRFTTKDGLKSLNVTHLAEDPDGSLWIGYYDAFGVTRMKIAGGVKTQHFTTANGLHSDKSIFLGFDARGWLWAGSDQGVDVFDRTRWRHHGHADGLIWDDCNSNAFMADANGSIWIGTSRGLSRYLPLESPKANVPPPMVFTTAKLMQSSVRVQYAALTFAQASNVVYRYKLAGVDDHWLETRQRELIYPKLPPGQYTLDVAASSADGTWTTEPIHYSFQIETPWFMAWWFRLASVLAVLLAGRLLWQRRTNRLEKERERLEIAVDERTRELLQANRFKSEFLANVSHEIRTPMNGILGMTDLVLATDLTPEQRELLSTARLSANSLLTILNDVLDLSKIEAGRLDLSPLDFSLRPFIDEAAKVFEMMAEEKRLVFEMKIADTVPDRLKGDPDRLRQVLLNLVTNAIKFTSKGGVYTSIDRLAEEDGVVTLRFDVCDTGIGIAKDKQALIFEAFRQADGSTTRKYGGTGLGLSISSHLVAMMGGELHVKSEPGKGSTFWFTAKFDIARSAAETHASSLQAMAQAIGVSKKEDAAPKKLRVLLAEDNLVNQKLAMRLLEKRGHSVATAITGRETLEMLAKEKFDVVLMDVQMPDMDGLEATAVIREQEKQSGGYLPIIALTAHAMKGDRERCLAAGMDNYINKPIEAATFAETVETTAREIAKRAEERARPS